MGGSRMGSGGEGKVDDSVVNSNSQQQLSCDQNGGPAKSMLVNGEGNVPVELSSSLHINQPCLTAAAAAAVAADDDEQEEEFDQEKSMILKRALHVGEGRAEGGSKQAEKSSLHSKSHDNIQCNLLTEEASLRMMRSSVHNTGASAQHLDPCAQEFRPYSLLQTQTQLYSLPSFPYHVYDGTQAHGHFHAFVHPTAGHVPHQQFVYGTEFNAAGAINYNIYTAPPLEMNYMPPIAPPPVWESGLRAQPEFVPAMLNHQPLGPCYRYYDNTGAATVPASDQLNSSFQQPMGTVMPRMTGRDHLSRSLLLSSVPSEISDTVLRQELNFWGPIRALQVERRQQGLVTVHYYDLRHAQAALTDIQEQHLMQQRRLQNHYQLLQMHSQKVQADEGVDSCKKVGLWDPQLPPAASSTRGLIGGKALWAQYAIPLGHTFGPDSHNQGTLVVFNLDVDISLDSLRSIFEIYGDVKELRETPSKRQHKFVEFFDVRDAARALAAMDGRDIGGKRVKIEFSRPGGQARRGRTHQFPSPTLHPNIQPVAMSSPIQHNPQRQQQTMYFRWNREREMWAQSSSYAPIDKGASVPVSAPVCSEDSRKTTQGQGHDSASYVAMQSAPSRGAFGPGRGRGDGRGGWIGGGGGRGSGGSFDGGFVRRRRGNGSHLKPDQQQQQHYHHQQMLIYSNANGIKNSACESFANNGHPNVRITCESIPQFVFNEAEAESNCTQARTTVMIKNIPNKYRRGNSMPSYSQQMLLAMLDQHCVSCNERITDSNEPHSAFDFVYLPIDFKNKCNLGYAFVNFTTAKATWKLYKSFHMQPWEAFNSRKICEVTYARVQGRSALEDHFRNSKFACDTDEYMPLVFSPPRNGHNLSTPIVVGGHLSSQQQQSNGPRNMNIEQEEDAGDSKVLGNVDNINNHTKWHGTALLRRHCGHNYSRVASDNNRNWNHAFGRRSSNNIHHRPLSASAAAGGSGRVECT
eukprot:Gb_21853 [translate_table: standard]